MHFNIDQILKDCAGFEGMLSLDEPMNQRTSFKIGGPADIFAIPSNSEDLQMILYWAKKNSQPVFVLGAGTNLLVSDKGIRGLVISLGKEFQRVEIRENILKAGSATRLSRVTREAMGRQLSGLEGLIGIPGTVGGAICMNAGTSHGCVKDSLDLVNAVDCNGDEKVIPATNLALGYRTCNIPGSNLIITSAAFNLTPEKQDAILEVVRNITIKRKRSQPGHIGNAGSVFKNPPGRFAGQILESVGAKGMQIGGARVSRRHANFIENTGHASASDVRLLIEKLQYLVEEEYGVKLENEIEFAGEWA